MNRMDGSLQDSSGYMVVMQCIWRPGIGVSELGLYVWVGWIYINYTAMLVSVDDNKSALHTYSRKFLCSRPKQQILSLTQTFLLHFSSETQEVGDVYKIPSHQTSCCSAAQLLFRTVSWEREQHQQQIGR
jgi:hypothetical protein